VIDPKNNTVISTLDVGIGMGDLKIGFNPSNGNGYVINQGFGYKRGSR
jgi:DNA-binding beta-propeller fold protein YncE